MLNRFRENSGKGRTPPPPPKKKKPESFKINYSFVDQSEKKKRMETFENAVFHQQKKNRET